MPGLFTLYNVKVVDHVRRLRHIAQSRQRFAHRQVARQGYEFSGHQAARAVIRVRQQLSDFRLLVILHSIEQIFGFCFRKIAEHVGCFVRRHAFQDVCGTLFIHVAEDLGLSLGRHLFQSFGGGFVVK